MLVPQNDLARSWYVGREKEDQPADALSPSSDSAIAVNLPSSAERFSRTLPNCYRRESNGFSRGTGDAVPLRGGAWLFF